MAKLFLRDTPPTSLSRLRGQPSAAGAQGLSPRQGCRCTPKRTTFVPMQVRTCRAARAFGEVHMLSYWMPSRRLLWPLHSHKWLGVASARRCGAIAAAARNVLDSAFPMSRQPEGIVADRVFARQRTYSMDLAAFAPWLCFDYSS